MRYATTADLPNLIALAREEHGSSRWSDLIFDAEAAWRTGASFIKSLGHTVLMTDNAYLFGLVQPMGFSMRLMAIEYAWYSRDNSGMELLRDFEIWAAAMGADEVVVHDHATSGRLARVLQRRRDYQPVGTTLIRSIGVQHAQAS